MCVSRPIFSGDTHILAQVIHTQVLKFHETFSKAKSLDEMIKMHDEQ
jgi:hypothetical protein